MLEDAQPTPLALPPQLTVEQVVGFQTWLRDGLGMRASSAEGLAAFVASATAVRPGPFRVTDLVGVGSAVVSAPAHELRYAIDKASWDACGLRRALVAAAQRADIDALAIEHAEVFDDGRPCDIVSLHARTSLGTMSLGWQVSPIPPPDRGEEIMDLSDAERLCVHRLLEDFAGDLAAVVPALPTALAPVIATLPAFGENFALRGEVGTFAPEYVMEVSGGYVDHRLMGHPYETQFRVIEPGGSAELRSVEPELEQVLVDPLGELDRRPRKVLQGHPERDAEYAVAFKRESRPAYVICRPRVVAPPGVPLGPRREKRALVLAELAKQVTNSEAAQRLRIADFRHLNQAGWQRSALVLSALAAHLQGWLEVP